jgi:thiol-disulfide isomerase/thioredoxin
LSPEKRVVGVERKTGRDLDESSDPGSPAGLQAQAEGPAPQDNFTFQDLYDHVVILSSAAERPATVPFFFSNTCPVVRPYVPRMNQLAADYRARDVQFIAVNVSPADTLDDVARFAWEYEISFPVVKDLRFDAVKALCISRTPEVSVLDQNFAKVYSGAHPRSVSPAQCGDHARGYSSTVGFRTRTRWDKP